ncbi:MAG: sarcosine oxidase subunit delta, partial [Rhodobacteraceae bacterium]|nr:sarcosine oxidase subunit delta [Paracoccaceae bacterium]
MQIFPCPFCGPREEHEFLFAAEAGKVRPEPAAKVSDEEWAAYLY